MVRTVVYIGNFAPPHSTENEVASCFDALGWRVVKAQEDRLDPGAVLASVADADLLLYTRTWGFAGAERLWARCAALGVPTASLHLDLFYGLHATKGELPRDAMPARDAMFRTAHVFTPDGDNDERWRADGVAHHWLPPAVGCASTWNGVPDPERWAGVEVAFVGSRGYHQEWPHRPRLLDELARRFGSAFVHIGGDGDYPGCDGHALRGDALQAMYATVPVIVGDSCWVNARPPSTRYWSDRVPEVWGRGGFLVMPMIDALARDLGRPSYPSWSPWDDFDAMEASVRYWLDHPQERSLARRIMVAEVRARHTWAQRIETMLTTMGVDHASV